MWFDSHCHLHLCAADSPVLGFVERARAAGVDVVTVGIDVDSSSASARIASEHGLWASAGIHPNDANGWDTDAAGTIEGLLGSDRVVAVGETGLDFYRELAPRDIQVSAFRDHIALAKRHDKALIIHTRDSVGAAIRVLEEDGPPKRLVFHCWSGSPSELQQALDVGAYISFAGNVSFRSADNLRELAAAVPDDRLLIETDAPFLAPIPHRGSSNEPSYVPLVGEAVAAARSTEIGLIAKQTDANARTLFGVG